MRIEKIYLDAFGPFTDVVLDLSDGAEGLHMVYGPNEAGKSSALRAIIQMFYGIPVRSDDAFIHPYGNMAVGASISADGEVLDFVRIKRNKGSLRRRAEDGVLDDTALDPFLGGMDEETFTTIFGLGHEHLVRGGHMILEGKGNVGEALFAASSGLADLRDIMTDLENESSDLFKPNAQKPVINNALSSLKDIRRNVRSKLLRPEEWDKVYRDRQRAEGRKKELSRDIAERTAESARLRRMREAAPLVVEYSGVQEQLQEVSDVPLLPGDFGERFKTALDARIHIENRIQEASSELDRKKKELENTEVNEAVLEQEDEIEALNELYATNKKALEDRRVLESELAGMKREAEHKLSLFREDMELGEVGSLRIKPPIRRRITELSQEWKTVQRRCEDSETAIEELRIERKGMASSLEEYRAVPSPEELSRTIRRIRKAGDIEELLRDRRENKTVMENQLTAGVSRLERWDGTLDELETLAIPSPETIGRFISDFDTVDSRRESLAERLEETRKNIEANEEEITVSRNGQEVPTEELLGKYRKARNICWKHVREDWEGGAPPGDIEQEKRDDILSGLDFEGGDLDNLADLYESITGKSDDVSDRLRAEADRVAKLARLEADRQLLQTREKELRSNLDDIDADRTHLRDSWKKLWNPLHIDPLPPREMESWARRVGELVKSIVEYRRTIAERERIAGDIERFRDELNVALQSVGEPPAGSDETLAAALDRGEETVAGLNASIQKRARLADDLEDMEEKRIPGAEEEVRRGRQALAAWEEAWAETMKKLGEPAALTPTEAIARIEQIDELVQLHDRIDDRMNRISQIENYDGSFRRKTSELAVVVGVDTAGLSAEHASQKLYAELKRNRTDESLRNSLSKQVADIRKRLNEAETELESTNRRLDELCREASVTDTDELSGVWERSSRRRAYEDKLGHLRERLVELSAGQSLDEFMREVADRNVTDLETEISRLDGELGDFSREKDEILVRIGELKKELDRMDGSDEATHLEEDLQTVLAGVAEHAERYARLKIAEAVLSRAVEQYREKNQGPMLNRAGAIFSRLTLQSFERLTTDFDGGDEAVLMGVRPDGGGRLPVSGMSEGTADQLYLSLRLAGLERYFENHSPVPCIFDDILVNFDNERAAATLAILAELSAKTQIVFFTHHRHIVDIAGKTIDGDILFTHEL